MLFINSARFIRPSPAISAFVMRIKKLSVLFISFALAASSLSAGRSERKAEAVAESGKPVAVKGGISFPVNQAYDATFEAVVKTLQKADEAVAVADRETGMIATEITITGGWRQTGTRTVVTLIKDSEKVTIVKVAVTTQKRYKALQTEPWDDPVLSKEKTPVAAEALRKSLENK